MMFQSSVNPQGSYATKADFPDRRLPKLTIVIPALNEEQCIASTIDRCAAALPRIQQIGQLGGIEVVVVNDGSTDRTPVIADELAQKYSWVSVIHFEANRGYGAALKAGFSLGTGEFMSFLDADGTCDPDFFGEMCLLLQSESADMVLGSRMGEQSRMPRTRRIGNRLYAILLGLLSGQMVTDTASGMRVLRREALRRLYPLPDGLQFTPAMSARAILGDMKIIELDMAYAERVGRSKLHPLRDGLRFLAAIFEALLRFRPARLFTAAAMLCLLVSVGWALYPIEFYLRNGHVEETMIYRFLLCAFLLTCSFVCVSSGVLAEQVLGLLQPARSRSFFSQAMAYLLSPGKLLVIAGVSGVAATVLVWHGLIEYLLTTRTSLHWSRAIVAVFFLEIMVSAAATAVLQSTIRLLWRQFRDANTASERWLHLPPTRHTEPTGD